MTTNLRQFDGRDLVARIKAKHRLNDSVPVGTFRCIDGKAALDTARGNNDVLAIANTDDTDLDEEVVLPSGCSWKYIEKNTTLFKDHKYDVEDIVAAYRAKTSIKSGNVLRGWEIRARLLEGDAHPGAAIIRSLIEQGVGIGMSIGFIATDAGRPTTEEAKRFPNAKSIVRECQLLEVSFTGMPCNVSCQTQVGTMDVSKAADIRRSVPGADLVLDLPLPILEFSI